MAASTIDRKPSDAHAAARAPVATGKVKGRRVLRFESVDEILREAERLAAAPRTRQLGNWTPGQVFEHLARAMDMSIDGARTRPPWFVRLVGPLMKRMVLKKMSAGFTLPPQAEAELVAGASITTQQGLASLRRAVHRQKTISTRVPSVVFGKFTNEQWEQLHCRHAEMHLSFIEAA
jgi:hypothetical protein